MTKTWKRWTQETKSFPKPKYGFTKLLKRIGDYVETYPMEYADRERFKDAAKFWAYYHKKTVNIRYIPDYQGSNPAWRVRVILIAQHRKRDLPTI